jgi:hypothetical protein
MLSVNCKRSYIHRKCYVIKVRSFLKKHVTNKFYIFRTVLLSIILVKWPTWRTISSIICLFESSTCFEQLCAHPQEDNCINTTYHKLHSFKKPIHIRLTTLPEHSCYPLPQHHIMWQIGLTGCETWSLTLRQEHKLNLNCNMFSFGCFPGVWVLIADVSEHSIGSIFKGRSIFHSPAFEDGTDRVLRNVGY